MKKLISLKASALLVIALFISGLSFAQTMPAPAKKPPLSPRDSVSGVVHGANISINYGAPSLRGRKMLGVVEPYGKPWRSGANQSTTFTTDKDIKVEGKLLPAGKYSFFTVPGETEWKIIFNSQTGQWGVKKDATDTRGFSANDDPTKDVLVVTVKPKKAGPTERLTYAIDKKGFSLIWEDVEIPVSVK
jgi:hypothetical protein